MHSFFSRVWSSPGDWIRFLRAYIWLFRARRLMNRAHGKQWLFGDRLPELAADRDGEAANVDWAAIKDKVAAISRASRYPKYWAYCLQRSLALHEWLASEGIFAEVRYGVRRQPGKFDAHAWVVYDGKILNDSVRHVSTFAELKSLDDYGAASSGEIQDAIVTSKVESEGAGNHV